MEAPREDGSWFHAVWEQLQVTSTRNPILMNTKMNKIISKTMTLALTVTLAFSATANAATFIVNTTADTQDALAGDGICADSGGGCSLRAAITEANALAGADIITLPAGTYTITLPTTGEDANVGGDFDITSSLTTSSLTINGAGSGTTIIQANALPAMATEGVIHCVMGILTVVINGVTVRHGTDDDKHHR